MLRIFGMLLFSVTVAAEAASLRITLDEAQAQAAGTKMAHLARLGVEAAKYHRQAIQADYFPKITAEFANLHFNKFLGERIQLVRRTAELPLLAKDQTIAAFTLTQPITPLLKVREAVRIARADEALAKAKADQVRSQVAANVERAYFTLLIAQRQRTPAAKELAEALNVMLGFAPETQLELTAPQPMTENISLQEATQQAIAHSPEIVEAEQDVVKARAATKISKLDYVPDFAVVGGYAYQTALPLVPKDFTYIGFIGSLNLFDFGKREKTINERKTQLEMAAANVDLVKAKVAANTQKAFLELQRARKIRDLTQRLASVDSGRPALISYEPSAEEDMFQAELDYRMAYSQLLQIMKGW
jgi:outer membrane protein TolC